MQQAAIVTPSTPQETDDTARSVVEIYSDYYKDKGQERNDIANPGVLFQNLAYDKCHIEAFRSVDRQASIADIGGGDGKGILALLRYGFSPDQLTLVDIHPQRVAAARRLLPSGVRVSEGDAARMSFLPDASFDVVTSSTMFLQMTDQILAGKIAAEMLRITKSGGHVLVFDWAYDFWKTGYCACNLARIQTLFAGAVVEKRIKGQLVPPLGRFLSKYLPVAYFPVQALPFTTGLYCYVMRKK